MTINSRIITALATLGIPVSFQAYKGTLTTYATFFEYLAQGESFSEDQEDTTGHYIQLDIWSRGDYTVQVTLAKTLMIAAGFNRTNETELVEIIDPSTTVYHKGMRFFYAEEI